MPYDYDLIYTGGWFKSEDVEDENLATYTDGWFGGNVVTAPAPVGPLVRVAPPGVEYGGYPSSWKKPRVRKVIKPLWDEEIEEDIIVFMMMEL